jgi:hypothetical protein
MYCIRGSSDKPAICESPERFTNTRSFIFPPFMGHIGSHMDISTGWRRDQAKLPSHSKSGPMLVGRGFRDRNPGEPQISSPARQRLELHPRLQADFPFLTGRPQRLGLLIKIAALQRATERPGERVYATLQEGSALVPKVRRDYQNLAIGWRI